MTLFIYVNFSDLATGGHIENRLNVERPDASTTKRILSELVVAVESLHNAHIHHGDLGYKNILIDNKGHLLLTDFSLSEVLTKQIDYGIGSVFVAYA